MGRAFSRYDVGRVGSCSVEELKRGLRHLKTLSPPLSSHDLNALADAFPASNRQVSEHAHTRTLLGCEAIPKASAHTRVVRHIR